MNQSVSLNLTQELNVKTKNAQSVSPFKQWQSWLLIVFAVQVVLTVGIFAYQKMSTQSSSAQPLVSFPMDKVTKVVIRDAANSATLLKSSGDWLLPDLHQLPIDQTKLNDLLDKLKATKLTWPVATTSSSHERFEVSDDKFQRRIAFYQDDKKLGEFFLGTTPGFKKIHLRRDGDKEVYAVTLNQFDFASNAADWFDKHIIDVKSLTSIKGADYQLQKAGQDWQLVGDESAKLNTSVLNQLTSGFTNVQILDVAKDTPQGESTLFNITGDGNTREYTFVKTADAHFVKRDDKDVYFKISQSDYEQLTKITKSQLIVPPAPEAKAEPAVSPQVAPSQSAPPAAK